MGDMNENARKPRTPREAPKAPSMGTGRSGWFVLALVLATLLAMRFLSAPAEAKVRDISETEFHDLVMMDAVKEVVRIREKDSASTYFLGKMDDHGTNAAFRVRLAPGENAAWQDVFIEQGINCPLKEKEPMFGSFVQQLLVMAFFVGLLWFICYRKMGGANGPFGFGKSKARMLNEEKGKKRLSFKDVAGVDEAREEVQEIVEFLKAPGKFSKLGGRIPKGVLMVGPPGTGKTLLAKAIAGEAKVPFFSISGSDFEEMFVGVGASRVRDMFDQAKKAAPCLVFIDEIDAVGAKRMGASAFTGRSNDQTLNAMLVEMDGFDANEGIIIIAATNRPDVLDPALLRPGRFDRQIYVDLPTLKGREEILKLHGKKIKFAPDADLSRIARGTPGFSGADLANLLNEAALLAVRQNLDGVTQAILEEARDKVLWGRERKSANLSQKDRETTAWHEAGHALLQLLLPNADPLHKVTIIPRGRALGATMALPEKDVLNRTRSYFVDEMCICCGGRVAEKFFTGDISTGAAQDIAQATEIARDMVCRYGMCETYGFQSFQEPSPFSGEEQSPPYSAKTAEGIDAEVKALIDAAYAKAEKLLAENRGKLETLAKALFEQESMDGRDVEKLLGLERPHEDAKAASAAPSAGKPADDESSEPPPEKA
ncbi:MAG: ATP-dependent zinc metalloprotease FtsH [Kiritimatiellae bacterium]|nr:ATP-dependent zinc metalloprotease FtsH [Kiritimatiellia bacterium]